MFIQKILYCALLLGCNLTIGCSKCDEKTVATLGNCSDEILQPSEIEYQQADIAISCLNGTIFDIIESQPGLEGEYDAISGNIEVGTYATALLIISDQAAWDALDEAECLVIPDPAPTVDWSSQTVVAASFEAYPGCNEGMGFTLMEDDDGKLNVQIDFTWIPDENASCSTALHFALVLDTPDPITPCLSIVKGCN